MLSLSPARCAGAAITLMVLTAWATSAPLTSARAAAPQTRASTTVLAEGLGMTGRPIVRVRRLQRTLERAGFDVGAPGSDGRFGPLTAAAVRRMQNRYGLAPDGVVGPRTRRVVALIADRELLRQQGAPGHHRPDTVRPQAPRHSATPHNAPRGTTPAQPTPAQRTPAQPTATQPTPARPTPTNAATRAQPTDTTVPTVLAATAALLAAAALATAFARGRRLQDGARLVAIPRDLFLEGQSDDEGIGTFRGYALAAALPSRAHGEPAQERYLVDDPGKPAPVWVRPSEIRRSPSTLRRGDPVLGYVTTDEHPVREHEQFIDIEEVCAHRAWELKEIIRDEPGARMSDRPGLTRALEEIAAGRAGGLVIADVLRLIRSPADLGSLLEWFRDAEATLVALDLDLDTSTVHGKPSASTLIALAEWDRKRARSRARSGLASVKPPGRAGAKSPPTKDDRAELVQRINAMRQAGMSLQAIADRLNQDGVPVLRRGATWRPSAVQAALGSVPRTTAPDQLPPADHVERQE